jgi:nicotinate-nucleotide pyrophosphorylase (carboxylating)
MTTPVPPPLPIVDDAVRRALDEDLGESGDITSSSVVPKGAQTKAVIASRAAGVVAGGDVAARVFYHLDNTLKVTPRLMDGAHLSAGDAVLELAGSARSILSAERVALNFLGHLSGIATSTAALVAAVDGTNARICCTRKTTPGLRALEKYAVRCGGGLNHRFGLYDAILIKDNHIAIAGGVSTAVEAAKSSAGHMVKIEVEVDTLAQLDEALASGAHIVLLDNMSPDLLREAVSRTAGRAVTEASGSITLATARAAAEAGVDLISVGWVTHSAPCLDLGLDFTD